MEGGLGDRPSLGARALERHGDIEALPAGPTLSRRDHSGQRLRLRRGDGAFMRVRGKVHHRAGLGFVVTHDRVQRQLGLPRAGHPRSHPNGNSASYIVVSRSSGGGTDRRHVCVRKIWAAPIGPSSQMEQPRSMWSRVIMMPPPRARKRRIPARSASSRPSPVSTANSHNSSYSERSSEESTLSGALTRDRDPAR